MFNLKVFNENILQNPVAVLAHRAALMARTLLMHPDHLPAIFL